MYEEFYGIAPFGQVPTEEQLAHMELGKKIFFHFGTNTFCNKEWGDGSEMEESFNPTDCNVREWISDARAAGFKLAIITAKHHDGFCLWPSEYTTHSIKNSPYKNGRGDIIREFTDACHEYNMKVGIYISPWDRHSPYWGTAEYSVYYANQLTELLTGYGKIDEIWWDGAGSRETPYDWGRWAYLIKKYQPTAQIFGSMGATPYVSLRWVGNEAGFAGRTHYASIDENDLFVEDVGVLNTGRLKGERYIPAEVDVSIRPGWFYHEEQDELVKTPLELDELWFRSVGNNAMMLLNIPPDRRGRLPRADIKNAITSHKRIEKMLSVNLLWGAELSASSQHCDATDIIKATLPDDGLFYASGDGRATVDILLPEGTPEYNVLLLGEFVRLGERITEFKLEAIDSGEPQLLCSGTSVGYLRAVRFDKTDKKHLRLTLVGAAKPLTLRTLSLNVYDSEGERGATDSGKTNLARLKSAEIIFSEDNKSARVMFGGIFPFDTIAFSAHWHGGKYTLYAFDGSKYYPIGEGVAKKYRVVHKLPEPIRTSYQILIEYEKSFSTEPDIVVQ
ncbi:MAG: alpha-L-fucosidase [Clostridia bacterium]|nr:alpha-L-fucosidase [Clostridia bacterium]